MKIKFAFSATFLAGIFLVVLFSCKTVVIEEPVVIDPPVSTSEIIFNPELTYGTMTDKSGNTYKTITIGTQTWMAENLRNTKYRNGIALKNVTDVNLWSTLPEGGFCYYQNDAKYLPVYGCLYNWWALVDSRKVAPVGWHVSTDADWKTLITYLDANADFSADWGVVSDQAGSKLKELGTTHWFPPNTGAANESGFTALPGGGRDAYSNFDLDFAGKVGMFWTASEGTSGGIYYQFSRKNETVYRGQFTQSSGFSVRLVMD